MAPTNPSPHRFLAGQTRKQSPTKQQPSRPAVRGSEAVEHHDQSRQPAPQRPAASQFAATPRFGFGRPSSAHAPAPPQSNFAQALRPSRPIEDVEETRGHADDDDDEMLMGDEEQMQALPTIERDNAEQWGSDLPYSPKRRRIEDHREPRTSTHETFRTAPSKPFFKHPTTPASHKASAPQNFSRAGSVASSHGGDAIRRPQFLRSSVAPSENFEPVPEAFSPHRRGEKFVPGGLAATAQQWVIETGQAAAHSRKGQGYLKGENYVMHVKVEHVNGTGPILVQGRQLDGNTVRLMLVADLKKETAVVPVGGHVGVRAPTWEIEIEGLRWTVGVDWKVMQQQQ